MQASAKPAIHEISIDNIQPGHATTEIGLLRQDSVVWVSKDRFRVIRIKPVSPDADYPFYRNTPMDSLQGTDNCWRASAGVPRSEIEYNKNGEKYKPLFQKLDASGKPVGPVIDPHISIHPGY